MRIPFRKLYWTMVLGLVVTHFLCGWFCMKSKSPAFDEPVFLCGGYYYNLRSDFSINAEGGVLGQRLAALPAYLPPAVKLPPPGITGMLDFNQQSRAGEFMELNSEYDSVLDRGRLMILLLSCAFAVFLCHVSSRIFGRAGGLVSMTLYCLSPMVISHATFVSADLCVSVFSFTAIYFVWRLFRRFGLLNIISASLGLAGAILSKMSGLIVLPVYFLMLGAALLSPFKLYWRLPGGRGIVRGRGRRAAVLAGGTLTGMVAVYLLIWLAYDFHFTMKTARGGEEKRWEDVTYERLLAKSKFRDMFQLAREYRVLPDGVLYGLAFVADYSPRKSFLNGRISPQGWWTFFPAGIMMKTPLPLLLLCLGALLSWGWFLWGGKVSGRRRRWLCRGYGVFPFVVFGVLYMTLAVTQRFNIGMRHILPLYPVMFLLCGVLGEWLRRKSRSLWAVLLLSMAALAWCNWRIAPYYNSYFNALAGGPEHGWKAMVDSSLDWGQDLKTLGRRLEKYRDEPVYLAWFGSFAVRPERYLGCGYEPVGAFFPYSRRDIVWELKPGIYCISATMIWNAYFRFDADVDTPESREYYRALSQDFAMIRKAAENRQSLDTLIAERGRPFLSRVTGEYEIFRYLYLCRYLRTKQPLDHAGYSILIFRLDEDDLKRVSQP